MADERTLARRYATALLDLAAKEKALDKVEEELYAIADLWKASVELRAVIADPRFPRDRKRDVVSKALTGKVSDLTVRFLGVLIEKGRMGLIQKIAEEFDDATDDAQGLVKAQVTSFLPLTDKQREKLLTAIAKMQKGQRVHLREKVDPALLGGIIVRVRDTVIDGSIAGKMKKLKERLILREDERARQATAGALAKRG